MAYDQYGGVPGKHDTGPAVSEYGFRVGTKESNTEVINNLGNIVKEGAVDANALKKEAMWSAIMSAGVGYGKDYLKTADGNDTLVANPDDDSNALVIVTVIEAFDDKTDSQPVFKIGKRVPTDDLDDVIMSADVLTDAPEGFQYVWSGEISETDDIINVNADDAEGDGEGAINVMAFIKEKPS